MLYISRYLSVFTIFAYLDVLLMPLVVYLLCSLFCICTVQPYYYDYFQNNIVSLRSICHSYYTRCSQFGCYHFVSRCTIFASLAIPQCVSINKTLSSIICECMNSFTFRLSSCGMNAQDSVLVYDDYLFFISLHWVLFKW